VAALLRPVGDTGILITYGSSIAEETSLRVLEAARRIREAAMPGVEDVIPAYTTVLVIFDREQTDYRALADALAADPGIASPPPLPEEDRPPRKLPTAYGGEDGPDLGEVARRTGLSPGEVVRRHTEREYRVYFLGFTPGYPYMGGLDPRLEIPRLHTPRTRVPAGSVAIAGLQTGLYPMESPGGWSLIGRTPLLLFDPTAEEPTYLRPGDRVHFESIPGPVTPPPPPRPEFSPREPLCLLGYPGLYTTLQDAGRRGFMHLGASRAGAADVLSLARANALVGNRPDAAALEMTALGPELRFLASARIATGGAHCGLLLDDESVEGRGPFRVKSGTRVRFTPFRVGLRAYLAVDGGFDGPLMMGSRSTDTVAEFGGIDGGALRANTILGRAQDAPGKAVPPAREALAGTKGDFVVRAIPGPQSHHFPDAAREALQSQAFTVSNDSNRMGLRLRGSAIIPHNDRGPDIISEGILPGSIQIPGDGHPIVMGPNAQTTGGYAKIAVVPSSDLALLGQAQPGDMVRFRLTDPPGESREI